MFPFELLFNPTYFEDYTNPLDLHYEASISWLLSASRICDKFFFASSFKTLLLSFTSSMLFDWFGSYDWLFYEDTYYLGTAEPLT